MQKRFLSFILILFAAIAVFSSCSKSNTQGRYIPKSAAIVVHVNGQTINAKLPWAAVKANALFKDIDDSAKIPQYLRAVIDNPENTGIDINNDIEFFVVKDSSGGYAAIEGTVKDEAKFIQFTKDASATTTASDKEGIHFLQNEKYTTSWNKDKFIILMNIPQMNYADKYRNGDDSLNTQPAVVKRDLIATATTLYALSESNSLAKDDQFSELLNTKGDVHFWANGETFNSSSLSNTPLSMVNMSKLTDGSKFASTISFDNGKIKIDAKSYSGKELSEIWKKYSGSKVNSDMVKRVPDTDIAFLMSMNFKPEGIRELLKLANLDGFANMGTAYLGFNLDDFIKANKGDILLEVSNLRKDSMGAPEMNILFSTSIGDKNSFAKLIDAGKKMGSEKMGDMMANKIFFNSNDRYFAIGNNKENIDKYISTTGNNSFPFFDKVYDTPFGMYINFQNIMTAMKPETSDSLDMAAFDASLKMWDNVLATGGEFNNGGITQHFEINLVDKTTNSLKQLNTYLGVIGDIAKKKKANNDTHFHWDDDQMKVDTTK
jgi:hypothetical protein